MMGENETPPPLSLSLSLSLPRGVGKEVARSEHAGMRKKEERLPARREVHVPAERKGALFWSLVRICLPLPALLVAQPPAPSAADRAFFFSRAARRAFPPRRALLFLVTSDDFSLRASARPRPPAAMAAGPKFLAGAAPLFPATPRSFSISLATQFSPRLSFFSPAAFHPSLPPNHSHPHPNFSNFSDGFFSPSVTTTPSLLLHPSERYPLSFSLRSLLFSSLCFPFE